jgi:preprotein translocase subunit YajC
VPQFAFILLLLAAFWFLLIRPAQRRQKQQQALLNEVEVGDEIVTAGGLYGTVTEVHDDEVLLEIAEGLEVRLARRAIAGVVNEPEEEDDEEEEVAEDDAEDGEPAGLADDTNESPQLGEAENRDERTEANLPG